MGDWEGRRALILSAAPCDNLDYVRDFLWENPDCIVLCADGGMKYAKELGIVPDVVVADFDSSREAIACRELVRLVPEKDDTDTQHCVSLAISRGCKEITLACATGGRLDHLMANLLLCESAYESGARLMVIDRQNTVFLHEGGCMRLFRKNAKRYVSILPLDSTLTGVTLRGMKYPLENAVLTRNHLISVSNEATEEQFSIEIKQGRALVIFAEDCTGIL